MPTDLTTLLSKFLNGLYGGYINTATELTFATLPATPAVGMLANISNSNTAVWGATAAGGGTDKVLVRWNGSVWTVVGK